MKVVGKYILLGIVVALGGLLTAELCGDFFTGMEWSAAAVLGGILYLCVVLVTCTGVIVSKIDGMNRLEKTEE